MPMIQVDDEVFAYIQKAAIPLVDDANSALRRMFGLTSNGESRAAPPTRLRVGRGQLTPHSLLRQLIFDVLIEHGGSATRRQVLEDIAGKLQGMLTEADIRPTRTGEFKWQNRASWERQNMVIAGLIRDDSPHGVWALTERGFLEGRAAQSASTEL